MDLPYSEESLMLDPIDIVEAVVGADHRFTSERGDEGDLSFSARGAWCDVAGFFTHREELPAVLLTATYDLRAPRGRLTEAAKLTALVNENMWLGHFDLWSEDGSIVFRHTVPMIGRAELSVGEVQALLTAAMEAGERFYPAFNYVIWGGKSAEEAMEAALFETVGEA